MVWSGLEGFSFRSIYQRVINEGLVPVVIKRNGKPQQFYPSTVEKILKNPFYRGRFTYGENEQGVVEEFQGKHELIVPNALLEKVDRRLGKTASITLHKHENLFRGFLVCGRDTCGCAICVSEKTKPSGRKYKYYSCTNGKRLHTTMRGMSMTEDQVFKAFEHVFDTFDINYQVAKQIRAELIRRHELDRERRKREADRYEILINGSQKEEDRLFDAYSSGALDTEGYKRQLQRIRSQQAMWRKQRDDANEFEFDRYLQRANIVLELATEAKSLWKSRTSLEKRNLLEKVLWNPRLDPPNVRFELRKPFSKEGLRI